MPFNQLLRYSGDFWGGLVGVAIALPQSIAFGVTLLVPIGVDASAGALAGVITAIALCLCSGIAGGASGIISAPTGPQLVLLTGAIATLQGAGLDNAGLLAGFAMIVAIAGLLQILVGATGGGHLVKYIPYPVVSGFMLGSAVLMIKSQVSPLFANLQTDGGGVLMRFLPALIAGITVLCIKFAPRWLPAVPGTIAGLVGGTVLFHLLAWLLPGAIPAHWIVGELPALGALHFYFSPALLDTLPWRIVFASAFALAVLGSLNSLLASMIADISTGYRHDARRTLIGQGCGNLLAGSLGAMAGAATTGATVASVRSGGRRWAAMVAGAVLLLLLLLGRKAGALLPVAVLSGIVFHVAFGLFERDILLWWRRAETRLDALIALAVTLITVLYDLMSAVSVGIAFAVLLFVRAQIRTPVVHRRSTATQRRSIRARSAEERALLDQHGDRIILYELRGSLFFGTADRLLEAIAPELDQPVWIIFGLHRVRQIDITGLKLLRQMAQRLSEHGGRMLFCDVHRGLGIGKKVKKAFRRISPDGAAVSVKTLNGVDEALEYAEDALLIALGHPPILASDRVALAESQLCKGMDAVQIAVVQRAVTEVRIPVGEYLFRRQQPGDALYVVITGEVDMRLPTTAHHYEHFGRYKSGAFFGELSLLDPGPRTADAVVTKDCELLELSQASFKRIQDDDPVAALQILKTIARITVNQQRWSTLELQRLAEW